MPLILFALLQVLDVATTLWFLREGIAEANPLVRAALVLCAPGLALPAAKLIGLAPAWWAWHSGRHALLRKMNVLFGACIAWNLAALWLHRPAG